MRKATLINQDWLRSKTMALAGDTIENIAFRLLLISDDFGRFPYDPEGLRVMMNDIRHSPEMITEAINYLVDKGTLEKYESDGQVICCWLRWHDYQNIRWSDDAKYPDKDGTYEVSNNPQTIAKRADKRNVKRVVKRADRHNVQQSESESESEEQSEEEDKTVKPDLPGHKFEPKHLKCVQELAAKARKSNKRFVSVKDKDGEKQATELAVIDRNGDNPRYRTILQCDYCWELLEEALWWAMDDDFLGQQLQSVSGLRKTWKNGMPKWVNICVKFLDDNLKRFGQDWLSKGERCERSREKNPQKQSGDTAILVKEVADALREPYPKPPLEE